MKVVKRGFTIDERETLIIPKWWNERHGTCTECLCEIEVFSTDIPMMIFEEEYRGGASVVFLCPNCGSKINIHA